MPKETLIILGASSDIGGAFLRALPKAYGKVIAHGHQSLARLQALSRERPDLEMDMVSADLSDAGQTQQMMDRLVAMGIVPTQIVHLPAPPFGYARLKELSWERVKREIDVQCRSFFLMCRTFLPLMAKQGGGRVVVLLSSVTLGVPPRFLTPYVTAKTALWGMVQSLAVEYAEKNVTFRALSPGMVDTRFVAELPEAVRQEMALQTPAQRFLSPEEVARGLWRLLSDNAGGKTATNEPL